MVLRFVKSMDVRVCIVWCLHSFVRRYVKNKAKLDKRGRVSSKYFEFSKKQQVRVHVTVSPLVVVLVWF